MTRDNVERVARAINEANGCPPDMWPDWVIDARVAMAATRKIDAEDLRQEAGTRGAQPVVAGLIYAAFTLEQRANELKETDDE